MCVQCARATCKSDMCNVRAPHARLTCAMCACDVQERHACALCNMCTCSQLFSTPKTPKNIPYRQKCVCFYKIEKSVKSLHPTVYLSPQELVNQGKPFLNSSWRYILLSVFRTNALVLESFTEEIDEKNYLKGQCHEIFAIFLFNESKPSGPLINRLKLFCLKFSFCRDFGEQFDSAKC